MAASDHRWSAARAKFWNPTGPNGYGSTCWISACANLEFLRFPGADFVHSYLDEAFLRGADLRDAWLVNANFQRADFRGAILSGARVMRADLGSARNLDRSALDQMQGDESTVWPEPLIT